MRRLLLLTSCTFMPGCSLAVSDNAQLGAAVLFVLAALALCAVAKALD